MPPFADALAEAGGASAAPERAARLRALLQDELRRGSAELAKARSGQHEPVTVVTAVVDGMLVGVAPVPPELRADADATGERGWLLTAALVGALVESAGSPPASLRAGPFAGALALAVASADPDAPELAALAFDDQVARVDRLRARALAVPAHVLSEATADLREPIGPRHPLRVAEAVAVDGGRPADPASVAEHEDAVLAALAAAGGAAAAATRPHEDPDPALRVARRIAQRLAGMGKWGGYHTDFAHLARGFAGNDRALAERVGEELIAAGLLAEKPSVGQRHVFLNPRRAADVYALIDDGVLPPGVRL